MPKTTKKCIVCDKNFNTYNNSQKLCSSKCLSVFKTKPKIKIECAVCGEKRFVVPSVITAKYCSKDCYHKAKNKIVKVNSKEFRFCNNSSCDNKNELLPIKEFGKKGNWCRKCRNDKRKQWARTNHGRYSVAVTQAKRRGICWQLSKEEYIQLAYQACIYCGCSTGDCGVGLDRKDSSKGYTSDNVIPCCGGCNTVRGHDYIPFEIMLNEIGPIIKHIKHIKNQKNL